MIKKVTNKKELRQFIHFIKDLYKDDPHMVYPIFYVLNKELKKEVLEKQFYTAILCIRDDKIVGRLLYTIDESKKQGKDICYFSYFDAINDLSVAKELFDYLEEDMKSKGINYIEGTFAPYDPDNRRGVQVEGFDTDPIIFTSYNYAYYQDLLEGVGFYKAIDTVLLDAPVTEDAKKRLKTFAKFFARGHNVSVDALNYKNIDKDIEDVHTILKAATNEIIYQDAPSIELIANVAKQMKLFIEPEFIRIAREEETGKPIGFCFVLPDFNQVFKKTKGRLRPIKILIEKRKITRARGMMQYIVPEYQNTGLIGYIYHSLFLELEKKGITQFEGGTMMEDNAKPINAFKRFGGKITKVYRLYGKDI